MSVRRSPRPSTARTLTVLPPEDARTESPSSASSTSSSLATFDNRKQKLARERVTKKLSRGSDVSSPTSSSRGRLDIVTAEKSAQQVVHDSNNNSLERDDDQKGAEQGNNFEEEEVLSLEQEEQNDKEEVPRHVGFLESLSYFKSKAKVAEQSPFKDEDESSSVNNTEVKQKEQDNTLRSIISRTDDDKLRKELEQILRLDDLLIEKTKKAKAVSMITDLEEKASRPPSPTGSVSSEASQNSRTSSRASDATHTFLTDPKTNRRRRSSKSSASSKAGDETQRSVASKSTSKTEPLRPQSNHLNESPAENKAATTARSADELLDTGRSPATEEAKASGKQQTQPDSPSNGGKWSKYPVLSPEDEIRLKHILVEIIPEDAEEDEPVKAAKGEAYTPSEAEEAREKEINNQLEDMLTVRTGSTDLLLPSDAESGNVDKVNTSTANPKSEKKVNIIADMRAERERKTRLRDLDAQLRQLSLTESYMDLLPSVRTKDGQKEKQPAVTKESLSHLLETATEEIRRVGKATQERLGQLMAEIGTEVKSLQLQKELLRNQGEYSPILDSGPLQIAKSNREEKETIERKDTHSIKPVEEQKQKGKQAQSKIPRPKGKPEMAQ